MKLQVIFINLVYVLYLSSCCYDTKEKNNVIYKGIESIEIEKLQNINIFRRNDVIVVRYLSKNNDLDYLQILIKKDKTISLFKYNQRWINIDSLSQIYKINNETNKNIKYGVFIIDELKLSEIYSFKGNKGLKMVTLDNKTFYFLKDSFMMHSFEIDSNFIKINNNLWLSR